MSSSSNATDSKSEIKDGIQKVKNEITDTQDKSVPKPENKIKEEVENVKVGKEGTASNNKSNSSKRSDNTKPASKPIDHTAFHQLLQDNVKNNKVNYKAIRASPEKLNQYLEDLKQTDISTLSKSAQLAFWINAYNASTIKLIITNYPIKSITKIANGKPWDDKWIPLDGQRLSLNNIENDIIRPTFNEPRIHFAVNCAAISCPPLHNKAWSAGNMNTYLEQQTKAFINDAQHNQISARQVKVSKIFEWYKEDFGDLITFLNKYSDTKIDADAKIEYAEYDWRLNGF